MIIAILREMIFYFYERPNATFQLLKNQKSNTYLKMEDPNFNAFRWVKNNTKPAGLVVFIHGLNSDPAVYNRHVEYMNETCEAMDCTLVAPFVKKRGNVSLDEAAKPFYELVKAYHDRYFTSPIALVGTSNGSRIAGQVDVWMRGRGCKMHVSSIAGVLDGTKLINETENWGITKRWLPQVVRDEMRHKSPRAQKLLRDMKTVPVRENAGDARDYLFFGTHDDTRVYPISSAMPQISQSVREKNNEKHICLVHIEHSSIVPFVSKEHSEYLLAWLQRNLAPEFKIQ